MESKAKVGTLKPGDFVTWNSSGKKAQGRITEIITSGKVRIPGSNYFMDASKEDPVALINIYKIGGDGWESSGMKVNHTFGSLRKIKPLKSTEDVMPIELKYLQVPFEFKSFEDEDDEFYTFSGYAATFNNVDRGNDVVVRGAFIKTIEKLMSNPKPAKLPALWQHDTKMPIGVFTELKEDDYGLFVKGKLPKSDTFVSGRVVPQIKTGSVSTFSIGYSTIDADYEDDKRFLKEVGLWEGSFITIPMNEKATLTDFKGFTSFQDLPIADRSTKWNPVAAKKRIKEWAGVEDTPNKQYQKAFLCFDAENSDNLTAYTIPIADVIDGQLKVVPKAVFAAAADAALSGVRGGKLSSEDKFKVINHVNKYYKKMDMDSPFSKSRGFRVDDLSILDIRDFEKLSRNGICVSQKNSKLMASKLKDILNFREDNLNDNSRDEDNNNHRDDDTNEKKEAWDSVMNELKEILKTN